MPAQHNINAKGNLLKMNDTFEPISLDGQSDYRRHLDQCPQKASDYSFINIWGWAEEYGLQWNWTPPLVWLRQTIPHTVYWAPVGDWQNTDWEQAFSRIAAPAPQFCRIPEQLVQIWETTAGIDLRFKSDRDNWDYLYGVEALARLKGRPFHKKKNLLNQFLKQYRFSYQPLNEETIASALDMQADWCTWRDCESSDVLSAENRVIDRILNRWSGLGGIMGGAIFVGDRMAAYTVAEDLGDEALLIHFEKGDPAYKGIYQAINQLYLNSVQQQFSVVNREQDLGSEGLRKAKLSYHPIDFIRKYKTVDRAA
jgi:hypothetical protein